MSVHGLEPVPGVTQGEGVGSGVEVGVGRGVGDGDGLDTAMVTKYGHVDTEPLS